MLYSFIAISIGASLGALFRWLLGLVLTSALPLALGTLAANLIGGYLIGLAIALFAQYPELSPAWRLFLITGFLGGLTTFSAFSAEVALLLQQNQLMWAMGAVALHVIGSVLMTMLGMATFAALKAV